MTKLYSNKINKLIIVKGDNFLKELWENDHFGKGSFSCNSFGKFHGKNVW